MRRDVFQAIADPTRREIIHLLSTKEMNLNAVAEQFNISRPAVSKHIKILTQCGLIEISRKGREHICEVKLAALEEVDSWVSQYRHEWEQRLHRLDSFLAKQSKSK